MNQPENDVLPFPRRLGNWTRPALESVLIIALLILTTWASMMVKDLRDLSGELAELRSEMAADAKKFEDARKRHAVQAATLMLTLEQANDKAKLLTQSLKGHQ